MIIENMKFTQLLDGQVDVKFRCCDCGEFGDEMRWFPGKILFATEFICPKCHELRLKRVEDRRRAYKEMSLWQKFRYNFIDCWKE